MADDESPIFIGARASRRKAGTLVAIEIRDRGRGIEKPNSPHRRAVRDEQGRRPADSGLLNVRKMVEVAHGAL